MGEINQLIIYDTWQQLKLSFLNLFWYITLQYYAQISYEFNRMITYQRPNQQIQQNEILLKHVCMKRARFNLHSIYFRFQ